MRRMVMGLLGLSLVLPGRAQTFAEWFKQNSTRLKYYAQQVAALQVYARELKREYQVSDGGLNSICGGKEGEYDLHQGYYSSLGTINPAVGQMPEVSEIAELQAAIVQRFSSALTRYRNDGLLGDDRVASVVQVYSGIVNAGFEDVQALSDVLTAGTWQMTDDQRMARIRELDGAMQRRYAFTLAVTDQADLLERQVLVARREINTVMWLYSGP